MRRPSISTAAMRLATATVSAALALLAISTPVGAAGAPTLVKDINPTGSSNPTGLTKVGSTLFFAANDGVHGTELWKSDGTAAGTKMVKDIRRYGRSSSPQNLVNVNGTLFFTANDGKHKEQVWKSDGTKAGTVRVTDIVNHDYVGGTYGLTMMAPPVAVGSRLFFVNGICCLGGQELWVTNGTATGTKRLLASEYSPTSAAAFNGRLYFVAASESLGIWVSDGTVDGTHALAGSPSADDMGILPASGRSLYFTIYRENDLQPYNQLWKTDGTKAGTKALTTPGELAGVESLADRLIPAAYMAKRLYFSDGAALWRTDGTAKGTKPISGGRADSLTAAGGKLYFGRGDLWMSDGSSAGTKDLMSFGGLGAGRLVAAGEEICFAVPDWDAMTWALWESNGTPAGTYAVKSFVNPDTEAEGPIGTAVGGRLFFAADDGTHGVELWSYTP